jgi:hypothetical protein
MYQQTVFYVFIPGDMMCLKKSLNFSAAPRGYIIPESIYTSSFRNIHEEIMKNNRVLGFFR